ncbi:Tyrosine-protein phosphatase cdcA [Fulvia fulva]|uniref:protein-tyrosine-phosphatase n=1 Tax=Passalora fulva TaxID=5499 RepID=A0A9Q8L8K8_PASFU|nr:Tyrosine-protein phosphatase cdcA [Fulvia fulva]KAK4634137.1 Tyrosine-protein phosphatase cdcA [Fulvia fulva]KAK4637706.1 Tyrosine-protein phosphatase cdcA [Fulvia fulva]UJO12173.1 Tyrosine-protein phosphatase cdcA [Fulvia fulva]WPV09670.1 Tyrosine-protein phosphatase cdcA [Fulvia fulva]WPV24288.1 Tyrosine-protein phosphatase cdcA [Fulvia fulva]
MPHHARSSQAEVPSVTSFGQVIEYIQDRLYLASYTHAPDENTPFPYPAKQSSRSPNKRSSRAQAGPQSVPTTPSAPPFYFSIDRSLLYNAFHADFGPLHIGHLYRFAVQLHEVLGHPDNENRAVVFWSSADSRSRANAACILATYMVLIQNWPPHLALAPIAQMDPPCMPFRDAGYSQADYSLTIQDVVYGVWKAKEEGLVGLKEFSLEEYEKYERVDMGDFNWVSPDFLAFASPQHQPTHIIPPSDPAYAQLPRSISAVQRDKSLPTPFKNVLVHFAERSIGLVVRLNSELYSPSYFTALGIKHLDMIFDDGTCPPLNLVKKFVNLAHSTINDKHKGIAVHCKAGLGRTGCLIGAYLVYRYGFTANEVIAFMRFMRPGMVVGPQQHWLHLNQGTFREWWFEDTMREKIMATVQPATPTRLQQSSSRRLASNGQTFTPPNGDRHAVSPRRALGEITNNEGAPTSNSYADDLKGSLGVADENLPAPTPGQPRKTNKVYGGRGIMTENQPFAAKVDAEVVSAQRTESEDERALRMLGRKASQSPVSRSGKRRAVSCTTTTTTTTKWDVPTDGSDSENRPETVDENDMPTNDRMASRTRPPRTPSAKSGNGIGALSVGKRSSPVRRSTEGKTSVRKTSGRVGSVGTQGVRAHKSS